MNDLRYAFRMLRKSPGFTAFAIIALALGIGGNTAIFSVVNGVLLKPLPYQEPNRLAGLWEDSSGRGSRNAVAGGVFTDWKEHNKSFESVSVIAGIDMNLTGEGEPERLTGWQVSSSCLQIFRVRPKAGRDFFSHEDKLGNDNKVVILAHSLWQRRFGSSPEIVGKRIRLNSEPYLVVGVLPPKALLSREIQFLVPFVFGTEEWQKSRGDHRLSVIGRLKPGVTFAEAKADLTRVKQQMRTLYPKWKENWGVTILPIHEQITSNIKRVLLILLGAVGFVLLIACVNVANLLLAKAAAREKEMTIRAALGASRWRTIRQMLTESLLLALIGGAFGLLLAIWAIDILTQLAETILPRAQEISLDPRVLTVSFLATLIVGLAFGIVPAWPASKRNLNNALKEGRRRSTLGSGNRLRNALIISEVALALILLAGAGLLLKSFFRLQSVPPGFAPGKVLALDLSLDERTYPDGERRLFLSTRLFRAWKACQASRL